MSADGFSVNYEELSNLGHQLAALRDEFSKGHCSMGVLLATTSYEDLRRKLWEFSMNWTDKKEGIIKRMDAAAGFAIDASQCYRAADEAVAAAYKEPAK